LIAGGTDILPNLKHWLDTPPVLVSIAQLTALRGIVCDREAGILRIGAGATLTQIAEHPAVAEHFPSLVQSASQVASPSIRNMGTIGGNLNLDTRCRYVNQTEFWRGAIGGGCIKSEGTVCHVVPKGRNCVAAMSSDNVPVLISLAATIVQVGPEGSRTVPLADYYHSDGTQHTHAKPGELTTEVQLPLPTGPRRSHYIKWCVRKSIDFPLVSVALRFDLERDDPAATITAVSVVAGVLSARPREVRRLDSVIGLALNDPKVAEIVSEAAFKQCKPLSNVPYEVAYRRRMIRVYTRRGVETLAGNSGK
ncbi:MAG: FAD binding domain-containing protein, partial [Nannocystaceae bacterium]